MARIEPGTRWKRRRLVQGVQRFCLVLRIDHTIGGAPIVVYRYTEPLFKRGTYLGRGRFEVAPRVNEQYTSPSRFLEIFEEVK